MAALVSKPGLTSASALAIPKEWSSQWFRSFIGDLLKGGDVRNAVGANGITISGTIASPYATISLGAPVTLPGPVTISAPNPAATALTVNGNAGQLIINASTRSTTLVGPQNGVMASAGGDYPYSGYNLQATNTSGVYDYIATDFASAVQFVSGGIKFFTAPSGTAGNPITLTQKMAIAQTGAVTIANALGVNGNSAPAQTTGFGTPVGGAVIANYNITDAGGANSNTNKCVAEILTILKNIGFIGA